MKNWLDTIGNESVKINLLSIYVFFLPLSDWSPVKLNSVLLILMALIWLTQCFRQPIDKNYYSSADFLLLTGIFFIQLLSIFHGGVASAVEFNLMVKLPFLILPLVFTRNLFTPAVVQKMQHFFITACVAACLVSFRFLLSSESIGLEGLMNAERYEDYLVLHRPYFGMYLLIAILFLADRIRQKFQLISLLLIVCFIVFLFLIQAKMSLLILMPILLIEGWYAKNHLLKRVTMLSSIILFSLMLAVLVRFYISNYQQVDKLAGKERFFVLSINTRLIHFQCGLETIKQYPLAGAGAGNVARLLDDCYQTTSHHFSQFKGKFNTHNEFLEETARHGFIGITVYLICYFFFFRRAIQSGDRVYLEILIIVVLASLSESVFSRSQGVMLVSFFNFMYFVKNSNRPSGES
ncbi:MAG: O-antigen ligase family protein [Bacteroidetes bacterium]|nr:O-antigen ligase family protein [Bacteroidota bacterium]